MRCYIICLTVSIEKKIISESPKGQKLHLGCSCTYQILFSFSIEEGLRQQALNRAQRVRKHASDTDALLRTDTGGSCTSNDNTPRKKQKPYSDDSSTENSMFDVPPEPVPSHPDPPPDIELVFRPYPKEGAEDRVDEARFIKTTANATGIFLLHTVFNSNIWTKISNLP